MYSLDHRALGVLIWCLFRGLFRLQGWERSPTIALQSGILRGRLEGTNRMKRIRILYVIMAVLVLASVGPLLFYAFKTMDINRRALETNEVLLQNTITRSVAEEISIYNETFHQLLDNLDHLLTMQPGLARAGQGFQSPELRTTLEGLISSSPHIIYITVLDAQGRGVGAGNTARTPIRFWCGRSTGPSPPRSSAANFKVIPY